MVRRTKQLRRCVKLKRFRKRHIYHIKPDYDRIRKEYNRRIIKQLIVGQK